MIDKPPKPSQVCKRCVMDTTIKGFKATDKGCNFCCSYEERIKNEIPHDKSQYLRSVIETIRTAGKDKPYDCIIGLSGGVGSSYIMKKDLDWQYYGGKHHESRFTKFFQAYYLPKKLGLSLEAFQKLIDGSKRSYSDFPNQAGLLELGLRIKTKYFTT